MTFSSPQDLVVAFLLVFVRIGAFLLIAPPFSSKSMPTRIRVTLAFALALPIFGRFVHDVPALSNTWALVGAVLFQVFCGVTMGFLTLVLFAAVQSAGELIDVFSQFAMASMLDPFSNTQSSVFGRIQYLIGTTLLFSSGGHLLMLRGVLGTFEIVPTAPQDAGALAKLVVKDVSQMALSGLEISGPIIACLFLADLALGMVSRAVPSLNVFQLSFPVKTILTVTLAAIAVALLPVSISHLVDEIVGEYQPSMQMLGG